TSDQIDAFDRDGFIVVPNVIPAQTIAAARQSAIDLMFEDSGQPLVWVAELGKENSQLGRMRPLNPDQKRPVMTAELLDVATTESTYRIASELLRETKLRMGL